ncbi:hypothetical protein NHF48_019845 [Sphingomonas sp. H160509]|uniref:hypothetical protein n=1 Tax=Sphingomonas sp. H160509 TaxID=2955313 RepID=UPI0020985430|nr:hypothetical protein [Sphingomonas sp. H160509]MDD1452672.1 hypothetical protein [Sphingomonas sp. H160509]
MPTIKSVVDKATASAIGDGQFGHYKDRLREMRDYIIRQAAQEGYSRSDIEDYVGHDLDDYCDQQLEMVWPHGAGKA